MSTSAVLKAAWAAVEEAGLPEKIHEVAFREAVRLVAPPASAAAQQTQVGKPGGSGRMQGGGAGSSGKAASDGDTQGKITMGEQDLVAKVANGTGVAPELLDSLIYLDDGELRLTLPGIKLGKNNADRTRAIASIFTVVRAFGLDEDDTSVELVRDEAQRLKCYDSANFSSQLKVLQGQGYVLKGSGSNRRIQVRGAGISEFPKLVSKLSGES